jgi:hypothetical protein
MSDTPETDAKSFIAFDTEGRKLVVVLATTSESFERERDALREENKRLIELLRRDEKPIWMDGARSGTNTGIDMAIKCLESLRGSILEKLKEGAK